MDKSQYVRETLDLMADTDWSRISQIQDSSSGDLKAAAVALWERGERSISGEGMVRLLVERYGYFSDYGALASAEKDTQTFMDKADDLKLGGGLLDQLNEAVSNALIRRYKEKGWAVVDLTARDGLDVESSEEGFYVFATERD